MSNFVNNLLYDNVHQGHFTNDLKFFQTQLSSPEHAPAYMIAANTGVIKAIASFYRINLDTAFERHRNRIPINDLNTVHAFKKHLIQFRGLKELTIKYGLEDFDIKFYLWHRNRAGKVITSPSQRTISRSWSFQVC